jgi:hypothetical protein
MVGEPVHAHAQVRSSSRCTLHNKRGVPRVRVRVPWALGPAVPAAVQPAACGGGGIALELGLLGPGLEPRTRTERGPLRTTYYVVRSALAARCALRAARHCFMYNGSLELTAPQHTTHRRKDLTP